MFETITEPKTIHFDLPKDVNNNLNFINAFYKTRLMDYCPNLSMETIFVKTENSKTNEPHRFLLHLSQRLD